MLSIVLLQRTATVSIRITAAHSYRGHSHPTHHFRRHSGCSCSGAHTDTTTHRSSCSRTDVCSSEATATSSTDPVRPLPSTVFCVCATLTCQCSRPSKAVGQHVTHPLAFTRTHDVLFLVFIPCQRVWARVCLRHIPSAYHNNSGDAFTLHCSLLCVVDLPPQSVWFTLTSTNSSRELIGMNFPSVVFCCTATTCTASTISSIRDIGWRRAHSTHSTATRPTPRAAPSVARPTSREDAGEGTGHFLHMVSSYPHHVLLARALTHDVFNAAQVLVTWFFKHSSGGWTVSSHRRSRAEQLLLSRALHEQTHARPTRFRMIKHRF